MMGDSTSSNLVLDSFCCISVRLLYCFNGQSMDENANKALSTIPFQEPEELLKGFASAKSHIMGTACRPNNPTGHSELGLQRTNELLASANLSKTKAKYVTTASA